MALNLPAKKILTLEAARLVATAAEAEALRNGWKVVIAIVDDGGHAILLQRLDGTQASSVDTALNKAKAAVGFKRMTGNLEDMINKGRAAFLSAPGDYAFLQGGVPIEVGGQIIGAVGVSGVKASDDEIIGLAGVAALKGALE
jgi:glc operon protein GlcG